MSSSHHFPHQKNTTILPRPFANLLLFLVLSTTACQEPDRPLRLTYDRNDRSYAQTAKLLQHILSNEGYNLELTPVDNAIEGARRVAEGKAEFSLVMDQTELDEHLGASVYRLRTMLPLFQRAAYAMYRPSVPEQINFLYLIMGRKVYAGEEGGERYNSFLRFMEYANFSDFEITTDTSEAEVMFFWSDTQAERAEALAANGWKIFNLDEANRAALCLRLGRIRPIDLPPTPSMMLDQFINTVASDVILLTSDRAEEDYVYEFTRALFAAKPRMVIQSPIYAYMTEDVQSADMPYPLSTGVEAYLRRDEPTFWERYAEVMALVIALIATASGVIQSLRLYWHRRRKERLDKYLLAFAAAKDQPDYAQRLQAIFDEALTNMTDERLDKHDFDILARLIYAELVAKR